MFPNFLVARNIAEQLKRGLRIVTDAPDARPDSLASPTWVTLPSSLVRPGNAKRARGTRDPADINLIVGHVSDVTGGFGVQRWGEDGWKTWLAALRLEDVPAPLLLDLLRDVIPEGSEDRLVADLLALCSRLAQLPYHRLASRKLGEVKNRPLEHRTWASGAGNGGVSFAMDCGHREQLDSPFIQAGINALCGLAYGLTSHGDPNREIFYAPHGCFSRQRWNDTHRIVHLAVVKPAIEQIRFAGVNISIDYERAVDGGRAITTRDDPEAHYDTKGRRV